VLQDHCHLASSFPVSSPLSLTYSTPNRGVPPFFSPLLLALAPSLSPSSFWTLFSGIELCSVLPPPLPCPLRATAARNRRLRPLLPSYADAITMCAANGQPQLACRVCPPRPLFLLPVCCSPPPEAVNLPTLSVFHPHRLSPLGSAKFMPLPRAAVKRSS